MSLSSSWPAGDSSSLRSTVPSLSGLAASNFFLTTAIVQRAVIIRIGGLDLRLGEPALELFGVERPVIVRVYFLEHLERAGISLRQVDRPIIVGIERLERCQAKAPRPLPSENCVESLLAT